MRSLTPRSVGLWLALLLLPVAQAIALPLAPTREITSTGTLNSGVGYVLAAPGSYIYGNSFSADEGATQISGAPAGIGFYDEYVFSISEALVNSIATTISLGTDLKIDNLHASLFSNSTLSSPLTTGSSSQFNVGNELGTAVTLSNLVLQPGIYVLQVSGLVSGVVGGSYSGVLNIAPAPVPLPASAWMLVSGIGALTSLLRRRRNVQTLTMA